MKQAECAPMPSMLWVRLVLVKQHGVLPSLIAADLYFWLDEKGKPLRWTTYSTWADWFCVSVDTVKRTQSAIKLLFTVKRTRRTVSGKSVLGANSYQLNQQEANRVSQRKSKRLTEIYTDPVQVFPLEFIKLAKEHGIGQRVPEFAWFLCRIGWLVHESEKHTGISGFAYIKSLKWLSEHCHTSVRTLERFIKQARSSGLLMLNPVGREIVIPPQAEPLMIQPFRRIEANRAAGIRDCAEAGEYYQQEWAEDELYKNGMAYP